MSFTRRERPLHFPARDLTTRAAHRAACTLWRLDMAISRSVFARVLPAALVLATSVPISASAQGALNAHQQLAREIYKELIEINSTTDADPGGTTQAAEAMA